MKNLLILAVFMLVGAADISAQDPFLADSVASYDDYGYGGDSAAVYMEERDLSDKPYLQSLYSGFENIKAAEQTLKQHGIDCTVSFYDDMEQNELQLVYNFADMVTFKSLDIEKFGNNGIKSMFETFYNIDKTNALSRQLISELKAEGLKLHYYFLYDDVNGKTYYKEALFTPADFQTIFDVVRLEQR